MKTTAMSWIKDGSSFSPVKSTVTINSSLPKGVYTLVEDPITMALSLDRVFDEFAFGYKIYGKDQKIIDHILKTFKATKDNLGILFNGIKGTGKTVTAKLIANEMNLPVILCARPYMNFVNFISKIEDGCILFFDEFEKNFKANEEDTGLLSLMDGVFNSPYRRIFLLTTNTMRVNENLIGRPSRIRYTKNFGNLDIKIVDEYLEDNLHDKSFKKEIMEFIDTLKISTIDILKSITDEVNIHKTSIKEFKEFFNVETMEYRWNTLIKWKSWGKGDYNKEKFKEELKLIGTLNEKGEPIEISDFTIKEDVFYSSRSVPYLAPGDKLGAFSITVPLDDDGIIVVEDNDGDEMYIKVKNIDMKPSLYGQQFIY